MNFNKSIFQDFEFDAIYHITSRVKEGQVVFREARDYQYFLGQMKEFVLPIADVYAYSLTPKKFQFLMCIKSKNQVCKSIGLDEDLDYHLEKQNQIILGQFEMILENYTSYFRQNTNEKTSVFGKFLQRIQIDDEKDLKNIVKMIHCEPVSLGLVAEPKDWKYSSYQSYLSKNKSSSVDRGFILSFFDSDEDFKQFHQ